MTAYLLDTNILIGLFAPRTREKVRHFLENLKRDATFYVCGMVLAEFYRGIDNRDAELYSSLLEDFPYFSSQKPIYEHAGLMAHELRKRGKTIPIVDCVIAQTAKYYNAILITTDADFLRFPRLKVKFYKLS